MRNVGILELSTDGGELTRNINQKKKPGILPIYGYPLFGKYWKQEYFFNKHVLNTMTQTREKWDSLFWLELAFELCESVIVFRIFIFIFLCLETTARKNTWMRTTFVTLMVIFSKVLFWNLATWSKLCGFSKAKFFSTIRRHIEQRHLRDTLQ